MVFTSSKTHLKLGQSSIRVCTRCIYDERVNEISFNCLGVCNYCDQVDRLKKEYGTGTKQGLDQLHEIIRKIRVSSKNKKYDCVVGISGGTDSSYLLYLCKKWNLRVLAVHYDNTWNSSIASQNMRKVLQALDIDLYTHVIDNKESDDIFKSFFLAGVAEIDGATDLGFAEVLYRAASKYKVNYVFEGHSFLTEGITPLGRNYFDGKYISSIHKKFGKGKMRTYPLMTFWKFLWWLCIKRIKRIRPFWYISHDKEEVRSFLEKNFDWQYYGGHHLENRLTSFYHSIYAPQKFNTDFRNNTIAARVRNGTLTRERGWDEYMSKPFIETELLSYFKKRLDISDAEYENIMKAPPKSWNEYPTYKKRFEFLRPLFYIFVKAQLVPESFYLKYCLPRKLSK
ncbi:MAG: LPS biosynthesis protein [Candidatus Endolissoclinum sp. TMED37]|nr:MAG: LPS biosynthesis protein [Candidatus Endolissoclinum sp. TMED37]